MSKKHFIALADAVRKYKPRLTVFNVSPDAEQFDKGYEKGFNEGMECLWNRLLPVLADFCQAQNPNFKRDRWLGYIAGECGPYGGVK